MPRPGIVSFRHVRVLAAVLALFLILPTTALPQTPAGKTGLSKREETGKRIYMEGTSSSGEPLRAWVRGDVPISGKIVPCVRCHRRSGMGVLEGRIAVHPVTGAAPYRPKEFYSAPQDRIGPSGRGDGARRRMDHPVTEPGGSISYSCNRISRFASR
jgi:hypothetical protein